MTVEPHRLADGILLRPIVVDDIPAVARAYDRNRAHLAPWDPRREEEFFTEAGQDVRFRHLSAARRDGRGERWVLVATGAALDSAVADAPDTSESEPATAAAKFEIVGSVALSAIELGPFRNARLGYWLDGAFAGRGLATAAVSRVCDIAAEHIGLHRIEAGTLLENTASQRVLAKCGFTEFGVAPRYLHINGAWRDHRMFQRILFDDEP